MHGRLGVTMVLLDDLVEHWSEGSVGVMAASIDTDSRVGVLGTREDGCLERDTTSVLLVLKLIPHSLVEVFAEKRSSASGEDGKSSKILRLLEMGAGHARGGLCWSSSLGGCSSLFRGNTTTKLLFSGDHSLYTIIHILDEVNLRAAKSPNVGDIIDVVGGLGVLSMDAADLNIELIGNRFEFLHANTELRKRDMDRSTKGCAKVCWARCNVTEMIVVGKTGHSLNVSSCLRKTGEDSTDVGTGLHRDDAELVLLIDPH